MERFNEVPHIEKKRVQKEERERRNDKMPDKASPYHDANLHNEITKILVQSGLVSKDSLDDMGFDTLDDMEKLNRDRLVPKPTLSPSSTPSGSPGRPKTSKDSTPRKTKRVLPRSKASLMSWAKEAQDKIAKVLAPAALDCFGKSNLRQLTKEESVSFEREKMHVLASLEFMEEPTEENIIKIVSAGLKTDSEFMEIYSSYLYDYVKENEKKPPVNIAREAQILTILTLAET